MCSTSLFVAIAIDSETCLTTEYFWDCECRHDFIHPITKEKCEDCGVLQMDQPESHVEDVIRMLTNKANGICRLARIDIEL